MSLDSSSPRNLVVNFAALNNQRRSSIDFPLTFDLEEEEDELSEAFWSGPRSRGRRHSIGPGGLDTSSPQYSPQSIEELVSLLRAKEVVEFEVSKLVIRSCEKQQF